jgi:hypothetical protein
MQLVVILQKAPGNAGFSKGGIQCALKRTKVFKGGGALDHSEKKAQVKPLSSGGMGIVHSAYLKTTLPHSP